MDKNPLWAEDLAREMDEAIAKVILTGMPAIFHVMTKDDGILQVTVARLDG